MYRQRERHLCSNQLSPGYVVILEGCDSDKDSDIIMTLRAGTLKEIVLVDDFMRRDHQTAAALLVASEATTGTWYQAYTPIQFFVFCWELQ